MENLVIEYQSQSDFVWLWIPVGLLGLMVVLAFVLGPAFSEKDGAVNLTGSVGKALSTFSHEGLVQVDGEIWKAVTVDGGIIERGDRVRIVGERHGFVLEVEKGSTSFELP